MAKDPKAGISFYRVDCGDVNRKEVRLMMSDVGTDGYFIFCCIRDYAYSNWGYYFDLNKPEDVEWFATDYCRMKLTLVKEVILSCIRRGVFDKAVADMFGILTNAQMQMAWINGTGARREKDYSFEIQEDWLLVDFKKKIPKNLDIIPGIKRIIQQKPATDTQDTVDTKDQRDGSPLDFLKSGNPKKAIQATGADFVAPFFPQVLAFFTEKIGDQRQANCWALDKLTKEAAKFINHYAGTGWKQGKEPIVDWKSVAMNWIIRENDGSFKSDQPEPPPPPKANPPTVQLTGIKLDTNRIYAKFLADPESLKYMEIDTLCYDAMKDAGMIDFNDDQTSDIRTRAIEYFTDNNFKVDELDDKEIIRMMKRVAVKDLFKILVKEGREYIFSPILKT